MYVYFDSKEDLFFSLIQEKLDDLGRKLKDVVESSDKPEVKIRNLVHMHLAFCEEDKDFFQMIIASERPRLEVDTRDRLREHVRETYVYYLHLIERVMQDGISVGMLKDMNPHLLATWLESLLRSFAEDWIWTGSKEALTEMEPVIMELFLEGASRQPLKR